MIRTEAEYNRARERLKADQDYLKQLRRSLAEADLDRGEQLRALQPALSFHGQLQEEVETYERMRRGQFDELRSLTSIGRWLIGVRIYRGWSQKELAERTDSNETQVSRDERNEYHNITTERAQRILQALGVNFSMDLEEFEAEGELVTN